VKIGILRETKVPADRRVALIPRHIKEIKRMLPSLQIVVQPSPDRCYTDAEFKKEGVALQEDLSDCDLLIGVKEVDIDALIPDKKYMFFAHVAKKQPHNKPLLQAILKKGISLIDHEYLTEDTGERVVAFGKWAGLIGAYKGLRAHGIKTKSFEIPPVKSLYEVEDLIAEAQKTKLPPVKIVLTGTGRVAGGAVETLEAFAVKKISPGEFITTNFDAPVYTQLGPDHYVVHKNSKAFDFMHFLGHPDEYHSTFASFTKSADIFIACHFWDPRSPDFITLPEMQATCFRISTIADISCDIGGPIPSTIRASTPDDPFYDFNPQTAQEEKPFENPENISVMAVDNLPGELPRDSSADFSFSLLHRVLPELQKDASTMINRATITKNGRLNTGYEYMADYAYG